ncbi:MAG: NAD(P)-dependent oxidoreductase, partial [Microbacterium sp.]
MRTLVTGGTGTVGLAVVERLRSGGDEVVVLAAGVPTGEVARAFEGFGVEVVPGDVRDADLVRRVLRERRIESVVHGAAVTPDVERERSDAADVVDVNCTGTAAVTGAFADACTGRFVHLGSIAAYGTATTEEELLVEDAGQERPATLYEITKLAGEQIALRVAEVRGVDAVSLRLGDVFGRWEHRSPVRDATSAPYQLLARALHGRGAVLPREGRKAWVYSVDVAEAVYLALHAESIPQRVANVSSPFVWSLGAWCALLEGRFPGFSHRVDAAEADIALFADNAPMSLAAASG